MNKLPSASPVAFSQATSVKSTERLVERTIRGAMITCREWGRPGDKVLIGIPGLSANSLSFADIAEAAAAAGYHVIVPDMRGRNLSPPTGSGTYGWENYARDICAIADAVGAKTFSVVGHSMGAFVTLELALLAKERIEKAVLMDALGSAEPEAARVAAGVIDRIDKIYPSADAYIDSIKSAGHIVPFTPTWERHYREQLIPVPGGVRQRTDKETVRQDVIYAVAHGTRGFFHRAWAALPVGTLVVRAGIPLAPRQGNIISETDAEQFKALRKDARLETVPATHYTVMTDPATVALVIRSLTQT